ncbi:unnamed protein product [Pleuronectes platessa]|uniref:Uncharacterized protein n=1 Tax=Pleuronectes platessa TaxID=8262 RepID=A0A9N7YE55_PLEPL|nr:unnamed protein product [Pleuronectes platessa]
MKFSLKKPTADYSTLKRRYVFQQASLLALSSLSLFPAAGSLCPLRDSKCSKRRKMSDVQLLRVSVHERISAAAEDFLLQLEKGGETARVPALRAMLTERLTAAEL